MKVLCFGSLNIDYVYRVPHFVGGGETLASESLHVFSGGKGLNQSVALARAGLEVYHAGAVGSDGIFLLDELKRSGVDVTHVQIRQELRTGHAIIQNESAGDNCILLFGGANRSIGREQIDRTLSCFQPGDVLVAQNEISELKYLLEKGQACGLITVLNPSPMEASLAALLPSVRILILNEIEAAQIVDRSLPPEELLRSLHVRYPEMTIVLTLGARGALLSSGTTVLHEPARRVKAVDTTAAGDTFTGFFLASYLTEQDPAKALEFAAAAAAIAVTRPGASPSIPIRDEVLRLLAGKE